VAPGPTRQLGQQGLPAGFTHVDSGLVTPANARLAAQEALRVLIEALDDARL
jgi:hypothetical protein